MAAPDISPGLSTQNLGDIALKEGYCTADQINKARERLRASGSKRDKDLAQILIDMGYLTQQQARACERQVQGNTVIAGFEILEKVGQGGMGAVFRARQVSMDRVVALKILPPKLAQDPSFKKRFLNEARACAKLSHLNIISGIDCGEAGGYTFFAMEFVEGRTINQIMKEKGKYDPPAALDIVRQMTEALGYAKRQGMVHRDVKPDNIMMTPSGVAKLCDLGLAKRIEGENDSSLTQAGQAVGTPHYISPEQAKGEGVDFNSDIYSLGATFYHMLTNRTPFNAPTSAAIMALHITEEIKSPCEIVPTIPVGYGQIISKMMAKSKADRYPSPEGLLDDLDALKIGKAPSAASFKAKSSCQMPHLAAAKGSLRGRTTGPQTPIGERSQTAPRAARSGEKSNSNLIYALVGGALLVVVAALALTGKGKPTNVVTAPNTPAPTPNVPQAGPNVPKPPAIVEPPPKVVEPPKVDNHDPPAHAEVQDQNKPADPAPKVPPPNRDPVDAPRQVILEQIRKMQRDVVAVANADPKQAAPAPVDESAVMREFLLIEANFIAALRKGDKNKAADMLAVAEKSPTLKALAPSLAQDRAALGWVAEIEQAVSKGIEKLRDADDIELQGTIHAGKNAAFQFADATPTTINLSSKDGASMSIQVDKLRPAVRGKLALMGLSDDATGFVRRAFINVLEMDGEAGAPLAAEVQTSIDRAQKANATPSDIAYLRRIFMVASDPALPALPPKDVLKQIDAHQDEATGDSWWNIADQENDAVRKDALRQRAAFWYTLALPGLTGASKASVEKRLGVAKPEVVHKLDAAVVEGLRWLAKNQEPDGHWDAQKFQSNAKTDLAVTGFALTALVRSGNSENGGPFQDNVKRAVAWLKSKQRENGYLCDKDANQDKSTAYSHAIAGMALIQAAGASRIPDTLAAAQKSVDYSTKEHQDLIGGGFRYAPKMAGCISVSGWYFQQLKAAKVAGLNVPKESLDKAMKFLDSVTQMEGQLMLFKYQPEQRVDLNHNHNMIGVATRLMFGAKPEEVLPTIEIAIERGGLPEWAPFGALKADLYYWHYGTLATSLVGGEAAKKWNEALKAALLPYQLHEGNDAGCWPVMGPWASMWGRVGQTALACACLMDATR